jgi:hypothetical protein
MKDDEVCTDCIYFNQIPVLHYGICELFSNKRVKYDDICEEFENMALIVETIHEIMEEEPFLRFYEMIDKIYEIYNGVYSQKLLKHLMVSPSSHEPVFQAWVHYKENRETLTRKKRKKRIDRETRSFLKKIELGLIPDPDGPTPAEEAKEIINSGQVCELCESMNVDCSIIEENRGDILREYRRIEKKRKHRFW